MSDRDAATSALDALRLEYLSRGYRIVAPREILADEDEETPFPDLIAGDDSEIVIIEVKQDATDRDREDVERLARLANLRGWRFELIVLASRHWPRPVDLASEEPPVPLRRSVILQELVLAADRVTGADAVSPNEAWRACWAAIVYADGLQERTGPSDESEVFDIEASVSPFARLKRLRSYGQLTDREVDRLDRLQMHAAFWGAAGPPDVLDWRSPAIAAIRTCRLLLDFDRPRIVEITEWFLERYKPSQLPLESLSAAIDPASVLREAFPAADDQVIEDALADLTQVSSSWEPR